MKQLGNNVRLDQPIGLAMRGIIFSPQGERVMRQAISEGMPPLAGVEPMIVEALGFNYGPGEAGAIQAGYLVWTRLFELGFEQGKPVAMPAGSVAQTATDVKR